MQHAAREARGQRQLEAQAARLHFWSIPLLRIAFCSYQRVRGGRRPLLGGMERPSLRLPAPPPPKRQRTAILDTVAAEPAAAVPEASPGVPPASPSPRDDDTAAEPDVPEALPNDAMVALLLLKSRFPPEVRSCWAATGKPKPQLHSACLSAMYGGAQGSPRLRPCSHACRPR